VDTSEFFISCGFNPIQSQSKQTGWWFQPFSIFHKKNGIWDVILPIDLHMFQDGEVAPPIKTVSMDESRVDE